MSLRDRLIGSWKLLSYTEAAATGGAVVHPLGEDASGLLIYGPEGQMSVMLMRAGRPRFASGDWFRPTDEEIAAASAYVAYGGGWSVDEAAMTVTHDVALSFFPNWIGQRQVRRVEFKGADLSLTPAVPIRSGGRLTNARLRWRRAAAACAPDVTAHARPAARNGP